MATSRICSIPDCGKGVLARGWCDTHYRRWHRHGDPLGGGPSPGWAEIYFREVVLAYDGDECLIWPYSRTRQGYGVLNGSIVSRLVCEEEYGPPPTPAHQAAHECGKGHKACVTKRHLNWKTRLENKADELGHGTRARGDRMGSAKLTEAKVRAILALKGKISQQAIGERFGVTRTNVAAIHQGKSWAWLE